MHLKWREETIELVKRLNIYAAQKKNWLPPNYGKKQYKDMTPEEQQVIKDFQGESEYNEIMLNPSKYLYKEDANLLLLNDKYC